jgi:hypothetical protein
VTDVFTWLEGERRWHVAYDDRPGAAAPVSAGTEHHLDARRDARPCQLWPLAAVSFGWIGQGSAIPTVPRSAIAQRCYTRFLAAFVERFAAPVDLVAAGHAAGYALEVARSAPGRFRHLALLAPTWRGPLPTAMGPHARCWSALEELVRAPLVGPLLYALNSSRGLIRWMMRRHVYAEPAHITDARLDVCVRTAHQPNARFAAAAFVTGGLDAFHSRNGFLEAARACSAPLFIAIGASTPPKSLAEMKALAELSGVEATTLPGSLALHDEYPSETAAAVAAFLDAS